MKKLNVLAVTAAVLVAPVAAFAQALCWYPAVCSRIWCYLSTPVIADSLSNQQYSDFVWYLATFCLA